MKVRYETLKNVLFQNSNLVHAVHIFEQNFTFCALAINDDYDTPYEHTNKKITCPSCIKWIDYCKSIKEKDIKRNK